MVATMIAGGDHIDDVNALRNGRTQAVLGHRVAAASTVGTFLRAFSHGHVRQLDAVIEDSFQRAWELGARPDQEVVKLDLDSSLIETYGFKKQGGNRGSPTCTRAATTRCSRSSRAAVRCCTRASADAFCSLNAQANAHDNGQLTTALLKTPKSWFACPRDAPADVRRVGQLRLTADSKGEKGIDRRFERTGTLKHLRE